MTNHQDVCSRWADRAAGKTDKKLLKGSRIFGDDNTIYSYGYHFALAHALRNKKGETVGFLLNGDRYSVSTTQHQSHIRHAVDRTYLPSVIIPFTALGAAGIDHKTIEVIHTEPQRTETIRHNAHSQPEGSVWRVIDTHGYVRKSDEEIAAILEQRNKYLVGREPLTVDDLQHYDVQSWVKTGERKALFTSAKSNTEIEVNETDDGTHYYWETTRHWLGESVIRAKVETVTFHTCKDCKGSGSKRDADGKGWFYPEDDYRHGYGEQFHCPTCGGRGRFSRAVSRTAYFLSGFDRNERRPSYFFCELPKGAKPTTVDEAYEALKPETVKLAEQHGRTVRRQGDIFAVALEGVDKRALRKQGATFTKGGTLHGTNHVATEVAVLKNGTTLARGVLRHTPTGRRPDHARVPIGTGWSIIVKNTVPITKG